MGRPINKRNFGSAAGNIQVTSYRFPGAAEAQATGSIGKQTGTHTFNVTDDTTAPYVYHELTLVNKAQGSLAEGEFIINAKHNTGVSGQVTKLRNRTIQEEGNANYAYTLSDSNAANATVRTVDII